MWRANTASISCPAVSYSYNVCNASMRACRRLLVVCCDARVDRVVFAIEGILFRWFGLLSDAIRGDILDEDIDEPDAQPQQALDGCADGLLGGAANRHHICVGAHDKIDVNDHLLTMNDQPNAMPWEWPPQRLWPMRTNLSQPCHAGCAQGSLFDYGTHHTTGNPHGAWLSCVGRSSLLIAPLVPLMIPGGAQREQSRRTLRLRC